MQIKVSIIIPTLGRATLYPLVKSLCGQEFLESFEVVLIAQNPLLENELSHHRIRVFYEEKGKGYAFYRNRGVSKSLGEICVFIDDDEWPQSKNWLQTITRPILNGHEQVVTAGYNIPLGQGYLTDCISLLGFPGGGAIGFETMWPVFQSKYTTHVCTGNLAILKNVLLAVGNFDKRGVYGAEDVRLGDELIKRGYRIYYEPKATVNHVARSGHFGFFRWNFLRGKSAGAYFKENKTSKKIEERFKSSIKVVKIVAERQPRYLLGLIWVMFHQYLWQALGASWKE